MYVLDYEQEPYIVPVCIPIHSARSERCLIGLCWMDDWVNYNLPFCVLTSSQDTIFPQKVLLVPSFFFSSWNALLSTLFSFAKTLEISHHLPICSPCHLAYWLCLLFSSSLLSGKSGPSSSTFCRDEKKLCQDCDPTSGVERHRVALPTTLPSTQTAPPTPRLP